MPGHPGTNLRRRRPGKALWPGTGFDGPQWTFTAPGVYCVELTWSATTTSGSAVSDTKELTFLVGDQDPDTVGLCVEDQEEAVLRAFSGSIG